MLNMIATTKQRADLADARNDFIALASYIMLAKSKVVEARALAEAEGTRPSVQRILERAEPGMTSAPGGSPETWGSALSDCAQAEQAFVASLRHSGAYDRMAADMIQVPLRTRLAVSTAAIVAAETSEAEAKAVFDLDLEGDMLSQKKVGETYCFFPRANRLGPRSIQRSFELEF